MNHKLKLSAVALIVSIALASAALAASSPAVSTGRASSVTTSSAVLNASINPNGARTSYQFELGLTRAYGRRTSLARIPRGSKSLAVKATVRGLLPGTVYHYRVDASNRFGGALGSDRTFRTAGNPPPAAATGPATRIGKTFATVSGVINPNGQQTTYMFQYGLTTSYSSETIGKSIPAGTKPVSVSEQLQGLAPATTFHYRIVALHGGSVVQYGNDATFFTEPSRPSVPRVRAATTPRHAKSAPFVFITSGRVIGPKSIPRSAACSENVLVRFFRGKRRVASILVPVRPDCSFSGQTVFKHLPGRRHKHRHVRLRVLIRFRGNGYLAAASARREMVILR